MTQIEIAAGGRDRETNRQTESTHVQYAQVPKQGDSSERFGEGGGGGGGRMCG